MGPLLGRRQLIEPSQASGFATIVEPKCGNARISASKTSQPASKIQPALLAAQRRTPSRQRENAWPNLRSRGKASPCSERDAGQRSELHFELQSFLCSNVTPVT